MIRFAIWTAGLLLMLPAVASTPRGQEHDRREALRDHAETHRKGFQQTDVPQFVFPVSGNRFSFSVGGFINLRGAYDMGGMVDNIDFVTYDIPVPGSYATRQKLTMDASTSRLFVKAIANTRSLGRVVVYIDGDFRGGAVNSYTPRLRSAYVSFLGLTLGRDVTTFCDLAAAPTTIDFQGPNAYNFNFATLIRYERSFADDRLSFGVAAEMPAVSGTYGEGFEPIPQRVPDIPAYIQYAWGPERSSHLRASVVLRDMYLHNLRTAENTSLLGWGVQLSGTIRCCRAFRMFMNGVYGKGITPYIQDLTGAGLDFTPDPRNAAYIQTMPMWGWQAAGQFYQFFKAIGDLTFKVFHQHLGHAYKVLGLVVGIGHAADILVYHVGSSSGECFGSREVPVKGRGNHIDAFVRTLCRENNCYQQLERIVIMQLCFGYGNVLPKPSKDFFITLFLSHLNLFL